MVYIKVCTPADKKKCFTYFRTKILRLYILIFVCFVMYMGVIVNVTSLEWGVR